MTHSSIAALGLAARTASRQLEHIPEERINATLRACAAALRLNTETILTANREDVAKAVTKNLSSALVDRLTLNAGRIDAMAKGLEDIAALPDPCGKTLAAWTRPNGLNISRVSVPLGVLGMIYEARPNVTVDAAGLCLKSRNAVILRGGSESFNSSMALYQVMQGVLDRNDFPPGCVSMVESSDRALVGEMLAADKYIDVMIPRGGRGLVERVKNEARMPVFLHLDGICHIYVHPAADPASAATIVVNAKMRRTGICGAAETLLLDKDLDPALAKQILTALEDAGCTLVTEPENWATEYLDAKISVKYVAGVEAAVDHINTYGSQHTDSILTEDTKTAEYFLSHVNSAIAMQNASTQFADGGEFGMGAEIGISTGKFHARGPVGVEQLTTYKYIVRGNGQIRP